MYFCNFIKHKTMGAMDRCSSAHEERSPKTKNRLKTFFDLLGFKELT